MTTEEVDASQSGIDDGAVGGPGAPMPLSILEVRPVIRCFLSFKFVTFMF
jgi:hypothetical protein